MQYQQKVFLKSQTVNYRNRCPPAAGGTVQTVYRVFRVCTRGNRVFRQFFGEKGFFHFSTEFSTLPHRFSTTEGIFAGFSILSAKFDRVSLHSFHRVFPKTGDGQWQKALDHAGSSANGYGGGLHIFSTAGAYSITGCNTVGYPCGFEKEMGAVAKKSDPPWVLRYWWLCGCALALLWLLSRIVE